MIFYNFISNFLAMSSANGFVFLAACIRAHFCSNVSLAFVVEEEFKTGVGAGEDSKWLFGLCEFIDDADVDMSGVYISVVPLVGYWWCCCCCCCNSIGVVGTYLVGIGGSGGGVMLFVALLSMVCGVAGIDWGVAKTDW